ncbi:MAG: DUF1795 domain-containing protein [Burkholderiaceae bacterium]|jgi:hypothetical protein|nr:MAG: DUF1795 domain-containing protein [Burkholderiaceae bacterium]
MNTSWTSAIQWQAPRQDWQDRSVLAFSVPVGHGAAVPPNVTLSRDERRAPQDPPGEAFEPYVKRQLAQLAQVLPQLTIVRHGELQGSAYPVREAVLRWQAGERLLCQWVVWLAMPDGTVLNFTATAANDHFEAVRPDFETALRQLQIRPEQLPAPKGA